MRQALPPRVLRRVANILDAEADVIGASYGCIIEGQSWQQRKKKPEFQDKDADQARQFKEYRRLAKRLRESVP